LSTTNTKNIRILGDDRYADGTAPAGVVIAASA
jgi:hypothetical protein